MDIVFNCEHCGQELEIDSAASGNVLQCPTCQNDIVVPSSDEFLAQEKEEPKTIVTESAPTPPPVTPPPAPKAPEPEEKTLSIPFSTEPTKELIKKAQKPLEVAAKEDDKKLRIKTIRRADCLELDKDTFDDTVSEFIQLVDQDHIISMHTVNYSTVD